MIKKRGHSKGPSPKVVSSKVIFIFLLIVIFVGFITIGLSLSSTTTTSSTKLASPDQQTNGEVSLTIIKAPLIQPEK